jgi:hypothetical protein
MLADFVRCTHNGTGGSGTITLAGVTGFPQPTDAFGTSGTRRVSYEIAEYTDGTKAQLSQAERGRGLLNLSTNVLTRDEVATTWIAGTGYNTASPSTLTLSATAANIDIILGASTVTQRPALPLVNSLSGVVGETYTPANTRIQLDSNVGTMTMTAGNRVYIGSEYAYGKRITSIGVKAASVTTTGNVRISVYEWGADGLPGNLITEFTSASQIGVNTATGIKTITLGTPFFLSPGWYYFMIQADAAVVLTSATVAGHSGMGSSGDRDVMFFNKSATYGAAPSVGDSPGSANTRSAGGQYVIYIK